MAVYRPKARTVEDMSREELLALYLKAKNDITRAMIKGYMIHAGIFLEDKEESSDSE